MIDKNEDQFFNEEEKMFEEMFEGLMECAYPNPDRIGCPDSRILRDIAFRRNVEIEIIDEVLTHMTECLPCCLQVRSYVDEYRQATE